MGTEEHLMGIREHEGHLDACFRPISSFTSALCSPVPVEEGGGLQVANINCKQLPSGGSLCKALHSTQTRCASSLTPTTALLLCVKSEPTNNAATYNRAKNDTLLATSPVLIFFPSCILGFEDVWDLMHIIGPCQWISLQGRHEG